MGGTRILKKTYFNGRNFRGKIFSCFPGHEKKIVKINFSKKRFRHLSGNKFPRKKNLIGSEVTNAILLLTINW